jgi:hypothetical protein
MHLPLTLICPLAHPDFELLAMGTQLSVSGTGLVPAGQPCEGWFAVMRLHFPFTSLKPSSQPVTFFATGALAGWLPVPSSSTTLPPDAGMTICRQAPALLVTIHGCVKNVSSSICSPFFR